MFSKEKNVLSQTHEAAVLRYLPKIGLPAWPCASHTAEREGVRAFPGPGPPAPTRNRCDLAQMSLRLLWVELRDEHHTRCPSQGVWPSCSSVLRRPPKTHFILLIFFFIQAGNTLITIFITRVFKHSSPGIIKWLSDPLPETALLSAKQVQRPGV